MQLAAAAGFALAVHENLLEFEEVARFPAGVDQVSELQQLAQANRRWADVLVELRAAWPDADVPVVLDGQIGPRGDGYVPGERMTGDEAATYHGEQIAAFAETPIEMVTAMTVNYAEEAVGVA